MLAVPLVNLTGPSPRTLAALLLLVAGVGACDGMAQGALFGEAALLPPRFTQALVSGTSLSGVAVSLLRLVTKATLPDTQSGLCASATLYFLLAAAVCAASTAAFLVLHRLPAVAAHKAAAVAASLAGGAEVGNAGLEADVEERRTTAEVAESWEEERQGSKEQRRLGSFAVELSYEEHVHDGSPLQQQRILDKRNGNSAPASASAHEALLLHGQRTHAATNGERGEDCQVLGWAAGGSNYHRNAAAEIWETAVPIWRLIAANAGIYM